MNDKILHLICSIGNHSHFWDLKILFQPAGLNIDFKTNGIRLLI